MPVITFANKVFYLQGRNGAFELRALDTNNNVSPWCNIVPSRALNQAVISLTIKETLDFETIPSFIVKVTCFPVYNI